VRGAALVIPINVLRPKIGPAPDRFAEDARLTRWRVWQQLSAGLPSSVHEGCGI
jgi:hypothetical protein